MPNPPPVTHNVITHPEGVHPPPNTPQYNRNNMFQGRLINVTNTIPPPPEVVTYRYRLGYNLI